MAIAPITLQIWDKMMQQRVFLLMDTSGQLLRFHNRLLIAEVSVTTVVVGTLTIAKGFFRLFV